MKRLLFSGLLVALIVAINCGPKEVLTITGSETMHPMLSFLGKEFERTNSNIKVQVFGGGSLEGIRSLQEGKTDIALSSRELSEQEARTLNQWGDLEKLTIAYDGVAIVVHPSNPIAKLSNSEISEIFSGKVTEWTNQTGSDKKIKVVVRNDNSGTLYYFSEHVLRMRDLGEKIYEANRKNQFVATAKIVKDNYEMADFIASNPNAIGFMGMGSALLENKGKVKTVSYALKQTDPYIDPSIENVLNRKYRLSRALNMIYKADLHPRTDAFATFLTSEEGQKLILKSGYLRASLPEVEVKSTD
ncbi:phosphate ABC transporter substrate-binding protein [Leptospira sp. GIMC2001]|uniref:phosphate ABC transporter substrate-binding protein n=1 Tax=Leptospira sp. GIMC2001 TaxID=1513297 RepID=UPI00234A1606|nr:phosphate ABC transporter substrate-binding protein [Leptospira sp. GIMC2001]WCL50076.1 phosphate ABC transporter substrate-binding protein [Leptospira sp. GIMC2001]